jgi:hypothetical protein
VTKLKTYMGGFSDLPDGWDDDENDGNQEGY